MILALRQSDYALIGRRLARQQPTFAVELLSVTSEAAHSTDLAHLSKYHQSFQQIYPSITDQKRTFIGCILSLYAPSAFRQSSDTIIKRGLVKAIALQLGTTHQYISLLIKDVIVQYKIYDDFRERVDELAAKMKGGDGE